MARWIVLHPGTGEAPSEDLDRVARDREIEMIAVPDPGLALVELPDRALPRLHRMLPGWKIHPEREGKLP